MNHLFCFGLSYTATHLIQDPFFLGWKVSATSRSLLKHTNAQVYIFDDLLILPQDITHILISIPPINQSDIVYERFEKQIKLLKNLKWIGYLSSTGVYGDYKGAWVTEDSFLLANTPHGKARVQAENLWQNADLHVNIFRLAGIYGPQRNILEKLKEGSLKWVDDSKQIFSRIHVEDIVKVLVSSIKHKTHNEIYNVADDYPCSMKEVVEYAAKLLKLPIPPPIPLEELSDMGKSFYMGCRKISNKKIKEQFGIRLKYDNYIKGLKSLLY